MSDLLDLPHDNLSFPMNPSSEADDPCRCETVTETLQRLHPLLQAEDTDLEVASRDSDSLRPSARAPFHEDD